LPALRNCLFLSVEKRDQLTKAGAQRKKYRNYVYFISVQERMVKPSGPGIKRHFIGYLKTKMIASNERTRPCSFSGVGTVDLGGYVNLVAEKYFKFS
jgi:hypothetical protein